MTRAMDQTETKSFFGPKAFILYFGLFIFLQAKQARSACPEGAGAQRLYNAGLGYD